MSCGIGVLRMSCLFCNMECWTVDDEAGSADAQPGKKPGRRSQLPWTFCGVPANLDSNCASKNLATRPQHQSDSRPFRCLWHSRKVAFRLDLYISSHYLSSMIPSNSNPLRTPCLSKPPDSQQFTEQTILRSGLIFVLFCKLW